MSKKQLKQFDVNTQLAISAHGSFDDGNFVIAGVRRNS